MRTICALALCLLVACDARLPIAGHGGPRLEWAITFSPESDPETVSSVTWIEVVDSAGSLSPESVILVRGAVTSKQLAELERDDPSKAMLDRVVPSRVFTRDGDVVVAPEIVLAPGEYAIASGHPRWSRSFTVRPSVLGKPLARVWPPAEAHGSAGALVYCDTRPMEGLSEPLELWPARSKGRFTNALDERCLRFELDSSFAEGIDPPFISPPARVELGPTSRALAPGSLSLGPYPSAPVQGLDCSAPSVAFGPGCALVEDDRLIVQAPSRPLLWSISGAKRRVLEPAPAGGAFLVRGLGPSDPFALSVTTIDVFGREATVTVTGVTSPPLAHVVINEVYANPIGAEPDQEWVELYNDGVAPVSLEGYRLVDAGGVTELGETVLMPGDFVLVVSESYSIDDGFDEPPTPGCLLLRVPKLGKNGLSNTGEPLRLESPDARVSAFPGQPTPKAGASVSRVEVDAFDDVPTSFALTKATPCSRNQSALKQSAPN